MNKCGIYQICNLINGKIYTGKTSRKFFTRWNEHKRRLNLKEPTDSTNLHLFRSWKKYGESNFEFIIVEECDINKLELCRYPEDAKNIILGYLAN